MVAVRTLLLAAIPSGTSEMEVCPSKVFPEQTTVDVPLKVKEMPLVLFKNWLFVTETEALPEKEASIVNVVVFVNVHEETSKLWGLAPKIASFMAEEIVNPLMALFVARVTASPLVLMSVFVMVGEVLVCAGMEIVPAAVCIPWLTPEPQNFWFAFKVIPEFIPRVVPSPGNT